MSTETTLNQITSVMQEAAERLHQLFIAHSPNDMDAVVWRDLPAERKVEIIKAMGFSPVGEPHTWDCPGNYSGNRCNCVPGPTLWSQPNDVLQYRHETWEERRQAARERREAREAAGL